MATKQKSPRTRPKRAKEGKVTKLCGAAKGNGDPCTQEAGTGTDHPGKGHCRWHDGSHTGGPMATARKLGVPVAVTPQQAIVGVLNLATGELMYANEKVAELEEDEVFGEEGPDKWVRFRQRAMDRVAKFAATAVGMGAVEAQGKLAEAQTTAVTSLIEAVLKDVDLTAKQRKKVGPAIRRNLPLLTGEATEK